MFSSRNYAWCVACCLNYGLHTDSKLLWLSVYAHCSVAPFCATGCWTTLTGGGGSEGGSSCSAKAAAFRVDASLICQEHLAARAHPFYHVARGKESPEHLSI